MIVQACLNGARNSDFHPQLPVSVEQLVESAVSAVRAGANELHVHVRDFDGVESLHPLNVDELIGELRNAASWNADRHQHRRLDRERR